MNIKDGHQLKHLQTRKAKLEAELIQLNKNLKLANEEYCKCKNQLKSIHYQISNFVKSDELIVTEHAVLRFIERKYKLDIKEIEKQIINDKVKSQILVLGNGKYPIGEGLKIVVKNNSVVTVL